VKTAPQTFHRFTQPIKTLAQRFAFLGLLLLAVGTMMLGKVDIILLEKARYQITDALTPLFDVLSKPLESVNRTVSDIEDLFRLRADNIQLKKDIERLRMWQTVAQKLQAENKNLRRLLNYVPDPKTSFIAARVIADTGGAFAYSLLLNAGLREGVKKGQVAIDGANLVGRIAGTGNRSSRLLLINDINSRIPVNIGNNRMPAILTGRNSEILRLTRLEPGAKPEPGERVYTSGHGGVFPPGIPIGVVIGEEDGTPTVRPFINRNRLESVRLIDYGLDGIVQPPTPGKTLP